MIDIDPRPEKSRTSSLHIGITTITLVGGVLGLIAYFSGYVTGIMTMRDTVASMDRRMTRIEDKSGEIRDALNQVVNELRLKGLTAPKQ